MGPSKSQVNKAGRLLRKMRDGSALVDQREVGDAIAVLATYRRQHNTPLNRAATRLRQMVGEEHISEARVGQRLKRTPMILRKLDRFPAMALTTMNDIAGCRCVVPSLDDLQRLHERVAGFRRATERYDYVAQPKATGYRGIHIIFAYEEGRVEVQLRTVAMNTWAQLVEEIDFRYRTTLKTDGKPAEVGSWLAVRSELVALVEAGDEPPDRLVAEYEREYARASAFLKGGTT